MSKIQENLDKIRKYTYKTGTRIIAVTKYVGYDKVIEAYDAGIRDFGENKVQDAIKKISSLPEEIQKSTTWHLVGHLQTNKVKGAVEYFDIIHSVDSIKLANVISNTAKSSGKTQKILIQVNVAEEVTKYGFTVEDIKEVFPKIAKLDSINIVGLMTIAPNSEDREFLRKIFKELRLLRDFFERKYGCNLPELSMGMSNDYEIAVEEGSTMIRIGHLLFKNN